MANASPERVYKELESNYRKIFFACYHIGLWSPGNTFVYRDCAGQSFRYSIYHYPTIHIWRPACRATRYILEVERGGIISPRVICGCLVMGELSLVCRFGCQSLKTIPS